jgi:hypothetical protein
MRPILALLFTAGCGGLGDATLLNTLEHDDLLALCEETPKESFTCALDGGSYEITIGCDEEADFTHVEFTDTCEATVGDARACTEALLTALRADPCAEMPAECEFQMSCVAAMTDM